MASFFFGTSKPEPTLGMSLLAKRDAELAARKVRWDEIFPKFSATFVLDVKLTLARELELHPENTNFLIDPNVIVTDPTLYTKKTFDYICGKATKKLLDEEGWALTHKALKASLADQDVEIITDDDQNYRFIISIVNAKRLSEEREAAAKAKPEAKTE